MNFLLCLPSILQDTEGNKTEMGGKPHVLALPYPAEGHITPLLHFTKRLASKGLKITLVIPTITSKSKNVAQIHETSMFKIEYISDGSENGEVCSTEAYFSRLKAEGSKNLAQLIEKLRNSNQPPNVLVYDSTLPWALEVAQQQGLRGASFFTESCAVSCIYYHLFKGALKIISEDQSAISVPPLPLLEIDDLPCFSTGTDSKSVEKFFSNQFLNIQKADWILFNTFEKLESEVANWMASRWPIKTIGPTILKDDKFNGTDNQLDKNSDSYIKWLDRREMKSVVYVSFGTVARLREEQMEEIARGLMRSNCYFLWIVRTEEESKLPANFRSEISQKGLIQEWCPQLEVLAHQAVACFVTHCGWNSTIEALSTGVPMIAMPCVVDQTTNAKFIADVWQAGVRVKANSKGIVTREEIETRIREVTQSERGKELKENALKWKQVIEKATAPGGSSDKNIEDFVSQLS